MSDHVLAMLSLWAHGKDLDDELDDIKVQSDLQEALIAAVPARRGTRASMEEYAQANTPSLMERPKFRQILVDLAQQLVDGYALDTEGLIDVLTLKAATSRSSKDPVIALEKLYRDTVSSTRSC